jgi:aminopeptidase N
VLVVGYHGHPQPTHAPTDRGDNEGLGWHTTRSGQAWTMQEPFGAFTWFPVNDHPSDKAFYDVTAHVRSDWRAVFNGALTSSTVAAGQRTMTWHLASPVASYLTTIAIGPYRQFHDSGPHGLPITYWLRDSDRTMLPRLRHTPAMLRWLESKLGPFPFDRVGTVVVPSRSAMETQTMVTMGNKVLPQPYGPSDLLHEYSHQWYGDAVTPTSWSDLWLNESFAMYIQIRWEASHGKRSMAAWRRDLVTYDQQLRDAYGPPGHYSRWAFAETNVYYCGALMLDRLRTKIGAHVFQRVLRSWPQRHRFDNEDRHDWVRWLNGITGRHLGQWVHHWLIAQKSPA